MIKTKESIISIQIHEFNTGGMHVQEKSCLTKSLLVQTSSEFHNLN